MLGERGTASGRRQEHEKGEGQIPGEQISHRSRRICAIRKGNNGFRWGEIAKGHVSPSFTLWEADHRKRRAKGMRGSFLRGMWGDVLKCTPDNLPQKRICMSSYWTLTLSFLKKIKKIKVHTNVCFLQSILFTSWDNCWSFFCFVSPSRWHWRRHKLTVHRVWEEILTHVLQSKRAPWQTGRVGNDHMRLRVHRLDPRDRHACSSSGQHQWVCIVF